MSTELMEKKMEFEVNGEPVKLTGNTVRSYLVNGNAEVTDQEVVMFMNLCKYQKLNPFLKEAFLVKFKSSGGDKPAQIIVSKEAFMKRAESHEKYAGLEAGVIVDRDGEMIEIEGAIKLKADVLVGGWAKVYRSDREKPVTVKISFSEFSKGQSTWNTMPLNMIRKTAVVNAMREAFPEKLNNMYTEEEGLPAQDAGESVVKQDITDNANQNIIDFEENEQEKEPAKEEKQPPKRKDITPKDEPLDGEKLTEEQAQQGGFPF